MSKYVYHFCVTWQRVAGETEYYDGVFNSDGEVLTYDDYKDLKADIAIHTGSYADKLTILSLNRLGVID